MTKINTSEDFKFSVSLRIDGRNCLRFVLRIIGVVAPLAVACAKLIAWFAERSS